MNVCVGVLGSTITGSDFEAGLQRDWQGFFLLFFPVFSSLVLWAPVVSVTSRPKMAVGRFAAQPKKSRAQPPPPQ